MQNLHLGLGILDSLGHTAAAYHSCNSWYPAVLLCSIVGFAGC